MNIVIGIGPNLYLAILPRSKSIKKLIFRKLRNRTQGDFSEHNLEEEFVKQFILNGSVVVPEESLLLPTNTLTEEIIQIEQKTKLY